MKLKEKLIENSIEKLVEKLKSYFSATTLTLTFVITVSNFWIFLQNEINEYFQIIKITIIILLSVAFAIDIGVLIYKKYIKYSQAQQELRDALKSRDEQQLELEHRLLSEQTEICILLPLSNSSQFIKEDCKLQVKGLGDHYSSLDDNNFPEITRYKFSFYDHGNCGKRCDIDKLTETVKKQLLKGTKYFICTMSAAGEFLSKEFPSLSQAYGKGDEILICTVASSKDITTNHQVLRLYIPAQQEIDKIYATVTVDGNHEKKFFVIYYDSKHPQECAVDFLAKFGKTLNEYNSLKISVNKNERDIKEILNSNLCYIRKYDALCIFAYGYKSYFPIIEFLRNNDIDFPIYTSSTFYYEKGKYENGVKIESDAEKIINGLHITTIRPKRLPTFGLEFDVVKYLFMHTVDKLIETIIIKDNNASRDPFFKIWKDSKKGKLKYEVKNDGDVEFELEALKI